MDRLDVGRSLQGLGGMEHGQGSINISDVIEVIQTTDPEFGVDAMYPGGGKDDAKKKAYIKIIEQPASKALRFRYECEGRSAGSIPGVSSTPENKTFPTIQVVGYTGPAIVVVSCVTKDPPYRPHPHNLVGKEGCKKGICTMRITNENMTVSFSNLGIQCVKKKDIEEALKQREDIRVDPFNTGFSHRNQPTSIDLNAVRLCFQVFVEGEVPERFNYALQPVVSEPIYDKKAMSDLVICKLSDCSSTVAGGKEIILLCEKVAKEDIQVYFYEMKDGVEVWHGFGDFQPAHVHKQVAISFRTPSYRVMQVEGPVNVFIQLRRPSDGAFSDSLPFQFTPIDSGRPAFWSFRKALGKKGNYSVFSSILASNTALLTGESAVNGSEQPSWDESEATKVESNNNEVLDNRKPSSYDYAEVNKTEVDSNANIQQSEDVETCRSLNELLSQVAELDEIYSDTRARMLNQGLSDAPPQIVEMDVEELYDDDDNQTYSSLQLAMKNPVELLGPYEDVMPQGNKRDDSKLPPLPPKRVRRDPPTPPARPREAPEKNLPPPPEPSSPKTAKPSLFQKLFAKKPKQGSKKDGASTPRAASVSREETPVSTVRRASEPVTPAPAPVELTEAEHYALYTDMAPHATASEFDEMSFYYSPVEGGTIVTPGENSLNKMSSSSSRDIFT